MSILSIDILFLVVLSCKKTPVLQDLNGRSDSWLLLATMRAHVHASSAIISTSRSEGFPNGIFHPCTLWARGLARWKNCRRAAVVVGVIWKTAKNTEAHTFPKWTCPKIPEMLVFFFWNNSPCGSFLDTGELFRTYPLQNWFIFTEISNTDFPFFCCNGLHYPVGFLMNIVHRNLFYDMEFELCDQKQ